MTREDFISIEEKKICQIFSHYIDHSYKDLTNKTKIPYEFSRNRGSKIVSE
jgi:hypothetical protein